MKEKDFQLLHSEKLRFFNSSGIVQNTAQLLNNFCKLIFEHFADTKMLLNWLKYVEQNQIIEIKNGMSLMTYITIIIKSLLFIKARNTFGIRILWARFGRIISQ